MDNMAGTNYILDDMNLTPQKNDTVNNVPQPKIDADLNVETITVPS